MNGFHRCSLLAVCFVSLSAHLTLAQDTPAPAPPAQNARPPEARVPIQPTSRLFPKTSPETRSSSSCISMRATSASNANSATPETPRPGRNDFPSDANPVKDKARLMIKMTDDLNTKFLAQLSDHKSTDAVTCGTCHRGMAHPEPFVPKPHEQGNRQPASSPTPAPQ